MDRGGGDGEIMPEDADQADIPPPPHDDRRPAGGAARHGYRPAQSLLLPPPGRRLGASARPARKSPLRLRPSWPSTPGCPPTEMRAAWRPTAGRRAERHSADLEPMHESSGPHTPASKGKHRRRRDGGGRAGGDGAAWESALSGGTEGAHAAALFPPPHPAAPPSDRRRRRRTPPALFCGPTARALGAVCAILQALWLRMPKTARLTGQTAVPARPDLGRGRRLEQP